MSQTKVKSGLLNFPDQTDFVKLPSGTTAQRPSSPEKGYSRYNTTDNKLEFWNGTIWQQLPGIVPPTIESVSYPGDDLAADPAGGQTITLTGTNFLAGATVEIEGTLAPVVTVVSKTEITFTAPAKTAGDYDILLTNGDNTTATFIDGITYNGLPSWTTPAGNLGTFVAGSTIPTITLVATEPDSGVVSYSVNTGALPSGLTLTGADIDGTVPSPAGQTTYNFSITASDDENQSTERAFNIVVYLQVTNTVSKLDPFGDSSGVILYKFDGDATDESGNYNGTASNVTWGGSGVFATSASFNGSNSIVSASKPAFLSGNPTFSVSMWIKPTNTNVFFQLGSEAIDQSFHAYTDFGTLNNLRIGVWGTDYLVLLDGKMNNYLNTWFNITLTHDGSTTKGYINGVLDNSSARTLSISSNNTMSIGSSVALSYPWAGSIDQVRIFNTALTPLEVESLYRERTVVCGGQADTLDILGDNSCIATYQLNGNANDLSGNYSGTPTDVSYGVGEFDLAGVFNTGAIITTNLNTGPQDVNTYSFWFKSDNTQSGGYIYFLYKNSSGVTYNIRNIYAVVDSQDIRIEAWGGSGNRMIVPFNWNDNNWHHLVVTFNYPQRDVYIDGSFVASQSTAEGTGTVFGNINIGNIPSNTSSTIAYPFELDQVRIFNKALNSTEVTTLYNETACDALACSGTTNTLDILSDGSCIAAYPLDGSPADLSGNYNGVQTDVTYPVGKFDLAGSFNGSSSKIVIDGPVITTGDFSVSVWAKQNSTKSYSEGIVSNNNEGTSTGFFIRRNSANLKWEFNLGAGGSAALSNSVVSLNQWYHIVAVYSGTLLVMYIDGVAQTTTANGTLSNSSSDLIIGTYSSLQTRYFDGSIDQVRIFDKALSASEVTTLYNETACN